MHWARICEAVCLLFQLPDETICLAVRDASATDMRERCIAGQVVKIVPMLNICPDVFGMLTPLQYLHKVCMSQQRLACKASCSCDKHIWLTSSAASHLSASPSCPTEMLAVRPA